MGPRMTKVSMLKKMVYCKYETFFDINIMVTTEKNPEIKYITYKKEKQREKS